MIVALVATILKLTKADEMRVALQVVDVRIDTPDKVIKKRVAIIALNAEHAVKIAYAQVVLPLCDLIGYEVDHKIEHRGDHGDLVVVSEEMVDIQMDETPDAYRDRCMAKKRTS